MCFRKTSPSFAPTAWPKTTRRTLDRLSCRARIPHRPRLQNRRYRHDRTCADANLPSGTTGSLAVDTEGKVWLAKHNQVGIIENGKYKQQFSTSDTTYIAPSASGGLWVAFGQSLNRYRDGKLTHVATLPQRHSSLYTLCLLEDRNGALWIGSTTAGLFRYTEAGGLEDVGTPQSRIVCLQEDRDGNIWAGTDAGFDRICPRAIEVELPKAGQPLPSVNSICEAPDGTIWASMVDGSLSVCTHGQWGSAPFTLPSDANCVTAGSDGTIWIGTRNERVYRWQSGKLSTWGVAEGVISHTITALAISRNHDAWIGGIAPYSVQCIRNDKLINFNLPPNTKRITAIVQDRQDNIWIGAGASAGQATLARITNDHLTDFTPLIGTRPVQTLFVAADNSLWIGFRFDGIGRLKNGRFTLISAKQGLDEQNISAIVADDRGWFWFGSERGIFKIREQDLNDVADGALARVEPVRYGDDEGLPPLQARTGVFPLATRGHDGRIWMVDATALAIVHPERIHEQLAAPPVCIERVSADDKTIASALNYFDGGGVAIGINPPLLGLSPDYHRLQFDFTALTFNSPENTRFRYRLDGFDEDWNEATSPRNAIYPRLPAGNYRFQVLASNADGIWNQHAAEISLSVAPFIWQTWWFESIAIVTFAAVLFFLWRYLRWLRRRLRLVEHRSALDRERARIARDIHDDLGHNLTQIVLLTEVRMHQHENATGNGNAPETGDAQLSRIRVTAQQGIRSLDETVWAINPRNDTLADLIDYIGHFTAQSLRAADIKYRLELPEHPPELVVPSEMRHAVFLVVKEAVNNILRHAQATLVRLSILIVEGVITINIADNGRGFTPGHGESGQDGLLNMKQRMTDIGGEFQLESSPGAGTRITLTCRWLKTAKGANSSIPRIREA